ncbi:Hypothetical predicted protein [Podarcis lilfordi]|uniref:C-type lectin domain-containing protein n=1 Tax=Podarcis lilfordi TaxID=74358 RepID=A0AA35JXP4_9SAUR|nr:Hypothetical predicted protein [Podarcis lilfordi]
MFLPNSLLCTMSKYTSVLVSFAACLHYLIISIFFSPFLGLHNLNLCLNIMSIHFNDFICFVGAALQLEPEKGKIVLNNGGCNASTDKFQAFLRLNFCNQNQNRSSDNSPCKVCPLQWQLHRDKCYWPSENIKSWNESQRDCSTRDSQLLVIQDKEELDFIESITKNSKYWIGLSLLKSKKKWMWITGFQLDQSL